jgi:peroxiredoxin-like protein
MQGSSRVQELPHHYVVSAECGPDRYARLTSPGLEAIESAGPAEFGGPGDLWSPETLLVAAVADCFILSFKAIARASRFDWLSISCRVEAELDRIDGITRFTRMVEHVVLDIPDATQEAKAHRLLDKAERSCLITNSLTAEMHLDAKVRAVG